MAMPPRLGLSGGGRNSIAGGIPTGGGGGPLGSLIIGGVGITVAGNVII